MLSKYLKLILFSTLILQASPKVFNSLGNELESFQGDCKGYQEISSLPKKVKKQCDLFNSKVNSAFKVGYKLNPYADSDISEKKLNTYLSLLRELEGRKKNILNLVYSEAKKAQKQSNTKYYSQLIENHILKLYSSDYEFMKKNQNIFSKNARYISHIKHLKSLEESRKPILVKTRVEVVTRTKKGKKGKSSTSTFPAGKVWMIKGEGSIDAASISPSGKYFAFASEGKGLEILNKSGKKVTTLPVERDVSSISFCTDEIIAFTTNYSKVSIADVRSGRIKSSIEVKSSTGGSAAQSVLDCNNQTLVIGDGGGFVGSYNLNGSTNWTKFTGGHVNQVNHFANDKVFSLSDGGTDVYIASLFSSTGKLLHETGIETNTFHSYLSVKSRAINGRIGALIAQEDSLVLYDDQLKNIRVYQIGRSDVIDVDEDYFAVGEGSTVSIFNITGKKIDNFKVLGDIETINLNQNRNEVLIGTSTGRVYLWKYKF